MSSSHQKGTARAEGSSRGKRDKASRDDDEIPTALNQTHAPSSTSWSIRTLPASGILPLTTLCMHTFAHHFRKSSFDEAAVEGLKEWLVAVPDNLIPRLFAIMKDKGVYPSNDFIAAYLLRGPSIVLDGGNMPEVSKYVVTAITRRAFTRENLRELHLRSLGKVPDATFASVIEKLPVLRVLDLGGCAKVAAQTVQAAAASCPHLSVLNVNHTAVPPVALAPVLQKCPDLTVLKVAGISSWTDANATKLWTALGLKDDTALRFPNLRTLKLKLTPVGDQVLNTILEICPDIRRLDVSFTNIQRPAGLIQNTALEKLLLTSTAMSSADMLKVVTGMTALRSLALGALGRKGGSSIAVANTSVMTMTDETLRKLTKALTGCKHLTNVNLAGNTKLGSVSGSALTSFVGQIGRNCEVLNLSGIPGLRSVHLEGLLGETAEVPVSPLRELALNNTGIDDTAAPFISTCKSLQTLEVGSTKLTDEGLYCIIDGCTRLERLDLTSCRGVPVAQRRNFFEAYYDDRTSTAD